ncbi:hypothetical protein [Agarilytica rhodophyticola]|uniref:hypothetical protein n=1 Tax=Agarilytica rhodophyticola TaxID=1737490 RepID=UPI000B346315|nr:hypothetical protein [Agarilytica rhodophyticola]
MGNEVYGKYSSHINRPILKSTKKAKSKMAAKASSKKPLMNTKRKDAKEAINDHNMDQLAIGMKGLTLDGSGIPKQIPKVAERGRIPHAGTGKATKIWSRK